MNINTTVRAKFLHCDYFLTIYYTHKIMDDVNRWFDTNIESNLEECSVKQAYNGLQINYTWVFRLAGMRQTFSCLSKLGGTTNLTQSLFGHDM